MSLHQSGRLLQAGTLYRQVLQIDPHHILALHYLGILAYETGKLEDAAALMSRVIALRPDFPEAHYNLGNTWDDLGKPEEAIASYGRTIALKPDYVEAHYNLGLLLQGQGKPDEAATCYRRALALRPDYAEAHNNLGIALKDLGQLDEAITCFRRALDMRPEYLEAHSNLLFCLDYLPAQSASFYLEQARLFGLKATARVGRRPSSEWVCSLAPERLRVGLVSDDFRSHPVGYFLENLLTNIDPERFELLAYPIRNNGDELTERIRSHFTAWKYLQGLDDAAAARLIHGDGINVLIDLSGHTSHNRLPVFAWKPAPVQVSCIGYFASTGLTEMDYLIADPVSVPAFCRKQFTEEIWYLPETRLCFAPPRTDRPLAPSPLPALHNGCVTFGCFQNLAKLNDQVLAAWGKIFQLLPNPRLRLQLPLFSSPGIREQLQKRLTRFGITPEKVSIKKPSPRLDYLAAHADIDIILDTFPFPGGTTTCEALWMGVPTLTLAGKTMLSRQGASLLSCAGLHDWIADDLDDYIVKAATHAADLEKLSHLRSGLREKVLSSPLFDGPRFARNFEKALWGMWQRFREG